LCADVCGFYSMTRPAVGRLLLNPGPLSSIYYQEYVNSGFFHKYE
jgi:hypothetical protein